MSREERRPDIRYESSVGDYRLNGSKGPTWMELSGKVRTDSGPNRGHTQRSICKRQRFSDQSRPHIWKIISRDRGKGMKEVSSSLRQPHTLLNNYGQDHSWHKFAGIFTISYDPTLHRYVETGDRTGERGIRK